MSTPEYRLKKAEDENAKLRAELAELTKWAEEAKEVLGIYHCESARIIFEIKGYYGMAEWADGLKEVVATYLLKEGK
jgi:hypothetical protein